MLTLLHGTEVVLQDIDDNIEEALLRNAHYFLNNNPLVINCTYINDQIATFITRFSNGKIVKCTYITKTALHTLHSKRIHVYFDTINNNTVNCSKRMKRALQLPLSEIIILNSNK